MKKEMESLEEQQQEKQVELDEANNEIAVKA